MKQKLTAAALTLLLTGSLFLSGCSSSSKTVDLMKDVKAADIQTDTALTEETLLSSTDFAVRLLQESITNKENLLISPLSLELALTMTAKRRRGRYAYPDGRGSWSSGQQTQSLSPCLCKAISR